MDGLERFYKKKMDNFGYLDTSSCDWIGFKKKRMAVIGFRRLCTILSCIFFDV